MSEEDNHEGNTSGLRSAYGHARNGDPLSINRAPASDIAPWVARIYATDIDADPNNVVRCGILSDTPILRVIFRGEWTAETIYGKGRYKRTAVFAGPQTKVMPVTVRGPFAVLGVALRPGAVDALNGPPIAETLDRVIYYDDVYGDQEWGRSKTLIKWFDPAGPPERWLAVADKLMRQLIALHGGHRPDPIIGAFDRAAFENPNFSVRDFCDEHGIGQRRLERLIKRAYGQTPKKVLRRARALDIAADLRGVADHAEAEVMALRYYDQSHMIREFSHFFGMTPKQFARSPAPLMTLTLEARQQRRLEVLGRNHPGTLPPWRR
ncbi:helix-turn-helix domain-containing protein [Altererythrobacter arenosus]|uniref:Helix-turn-helix domain-containing protein n=1 Tax=Altererythrobacter arenosus TaxID=3032592 RepID=A0ABY8FVP2_9SPHN|nr:helix-turn-helix domain-containing protein [Altererythrobacter sp. CAU 1644]WFL78802.1 helix-turn-helix domain-containing protein [Altererythrobacter sp. CAU 1644]